jgi:hypothetical protein
LHALQSSEVDGGDFIIGKPNIVFDAAVGGWNEKPVTKHAILRRFNGNM